MIHTILLSFVAALGTVVTPFDIRLTTIYGVCALAVETDLIHSRWKVEKCIRPEVFRGWNDSNVAFRERMSSRKTLRNFDLKAGDASASFYPSQGSCEMIKLSSWREPNVDEYFESLTQGAPEHGIT